MMYRMKTLLLAAGALALAAAAPASAQTRWNLPSAYPADNPHSETLVAFAKQVADATGGKLQIAVHAGASLFKAPEIKRAVATGQAQAGEVLISLHENEDAIFGIDVVPFLATSYAESKKLYLASKPALEKKLDDLQPELSQVVNKVTRDALKQNPALDDLRAAAFRTAIDKIARSYMELGVFP